MSTNKLYLGYHVSSAGGYMAMGKRAAALGVTLTVEDAAVERIADEGFDPLYGARPLRRLLRNELEDRLAHELLFGSLKKGGSARLTLKDDALALMPTASPRAKAARQSVEA